MTVTEPGQQRLGVGARRTLARDDGQDLVAGLDEAGEQSLGTLVSRRT